MRTATGCENCDSEEKACAFCTDCCDKGLQICKQCEEFHKKFRSYENQTVVDLDPDLKKIVLESNERDSVTCTKHGSEVLKYFCQVCEALVCSDCVISDHANHTYKALQSSFDEGKTELESSCSVLE